MKNITQLISITFFFLFISITLSAQNKPFTAKFVGTSFPDDPFSFYVDIAVVAGLTYDYVVDWGDGTEDLNVQGTISHVYASSGTFTIRIYGDFPGIQVNKATVGKIVSIESWGDIEWETMKDAFKDAEDMVVNASDKPDLSLVKNTSGMFDGATKANPNLSGWDLSNVTDMSRMFRGTEMFTGLNIAGWDVSKAENLESMFEGTLVFNNDLFHWKVDNVTNMRNMFKNAEAFNHSIAEWKVDNVTNMSGMFSGALAFNQDIQQTIHYWEVDNVTNMDSMFYQASAFNQNISDWNVGNVKRMASMFNQASAFNQDISGWNVVKVTNMNSMFANTDVFDQDLNTWPVSQVEDMGSMFEYAQVFNQDLDAWNLMNLKVIKDIFSEAPKFNGDISTWRFPKVRDMSGMFFGAIAFNQDLNSWDVSQVVDMSSLFTNAENFNGKISLWQLDNVEMMESMFSGAVKFNNDVEGWKMPKAKNMSDMFYGASAFNRDLFSWKVATVENMSQMFYEASAFNSNLNSWQLGQVTNLDRMFYGATSFSGDVTDWKMPKAKSMIEMFSGAIAFNRDINDWDVANVTDMRSMFEGAIIFDHALDQWQLDSVTMMADMLSNSGMSPDNYDKTLIAWSSQNLRENVTLGATGLEYCAAIAARDILINTFNWIIHGDKRCVLPFITKWDTNNSGISNPASIKIPTFLGETYDYDVDWGDGQETKGVTGDATHEYADPGVYTVKIKGKFPRIYFNGDGDRNKIISIENWGDVKWSNMEAAFFGCENMQSNATDVPDLTNVTDMSFMFLNASSYQGNCSEWNVSGVTEMDFMFSNAISFDNELSLWDVSNVTSMYFMFDGASSFDQDLGSWDISMVTEMDNMLSNTALTMENYDNTLTGWASGTVQGDVTLGADNLTYCSSESDRQFLIDNYNWTFVNDSKCVLPFVTTWKTDNPGASNSTSIIIPIFVDEFNTETYDYTVDWGDGTMTSGHNGDAVHDYGVAGEYTVKITGLFPRIHFNNVTDKDKILSIVSWGTNKWTSMESAFTGCSNLVSTAMDEPDLSNVTDMSFMFYFATSYSGGCSNWDVSGVTEMDFMFADAHAFDGDITGWDVANVTSMYFMFDNATNFNQDLGNWDISMVTEMNNMLSNTALTMDNYDNTLTGWANRAVEGGVQGDVTFGVDGLAYCRAGDARDILISNDWTITGDVFSCAPLPIELTSFSGERLDNHQVELYWETATETNNEKFEIWRRFDTEEEFRFLGETTGGGTTTETQQYNYLDANDHAGISYYQLKQVDFDGAFTWSNTITVEASVLSSVVSVFPNPVSEVLSVQTVGNKSLAYALYNPIGKLVRSNILQTDTKINVGDLPSGIYWLQIRDVNNLLVETKKLLFVRE